NDTLTGSDSATFESFEGREGNDQIDGKGGVDRVDYTSSMAGVIVNLLTGTVSDGFGGTDTLANIENVRGSRDFNDSITGSTANNKLEGLGGNDTLDGGVGADTMIGGDGSDSYYVDNAGDLVGESNADFAIGGNDIVYSTLAAYTLTANVERLRLMLAGASNGTGNALDNTLYAGAGDNVLDGAAGNDTVSYVFASAGVTVSLASAGAQATGGSGTDTLISIENLIGSGFNDNLTGNIANNVLDGGAGSDFLNGATGADTMLGGDGTDSYAVDHAGDLVSESNGSLAIGGNDVVYSYLAAYTLPANVERLRLMLAGASNGTGNALDNTLYAGDGNNVLDGAGGNDTVSYAFATAGVTVSLATAGAQATGGSGSDTLISIENLIGSGFNDSLTGNAANNVLDGGAGSDFLNGATGADTMLGGDGTDSYAVDHAGDLVSESNGSLATGGNDIVYSYLAAYTLTANVERLRLMLAGASNGTGNALDNTLYAGDGNNVLDGAAGNDTVSYAFASAGVTVSLATAGAQATGGSGSDTLISIENLIGSGFNDSLIGNTANNVLNGGAGSDFLNGATGADTMLGGDGTDSYAVDHAGDLVTESNGSLATGGNDIVYSYLASYTLTANVERLRLMLAGASNASGNGLDNTLYAGAGNNVLDGAAGNDTVSYAFATAGVTLSLATAGAQATGGSASDTLISIEHLIGSGFNDSLTGNTANNVLDGGAGSDFLNGATGADTMLGGDGTDSYCVDHAGDIVSESNGSLATGGNDIVYSYLAAYTLTANVERLRLMLAGASNGTGNALDNTLYAGDGNNVLNGVSGVDTASYQFATAAVSVSLATTAAQATGGSGSDTLQNMDNLVGSSFHDTLVGDAQANTLNGLALNDYLDGGAGNDVLLGGEGTDLLIGGLGQDLLTGGAGSDTFDFNALNETGLTNTTWDVISDFVHGTDKLDLATLDADTALAGDQAFTDPVLGGTFSGVFASPGDLYFDTVAHVLYGNTDADTAAEFAIQLVGVATLTAADLFL
ncbi:MAG: M10 family metallopeptidase C-terminal domain-containing protein, partial [Candidatus Accumulibacter sp.]|nr:M10 family metallopeptidase C-terminal domain-containing protein [Candidatus Accumulibacter propinquus]